MAATVITKTFEIGQVPAKELGSEAVSSIILSTDSLFLVAHLTQNYSSDLEQVIRTRAAILIGPWPTNLTMFVLADATGFHVDLVATLDPQARRYRSRVSALINDIKLECKLVALKRRARERSTDILAPR